MAPPTRTGAGASSAAGIAKQRASKRKPACPPGHLLLGLAGSRQVAADQPASFVVIARPCRGTRVTLRRIRLHVRGPQSASWLVRRLRRTAVARRAITLTFPPPAAAAAAAIVTLEARSRRGTLLGRVHVTIYFLSPPPPAAKPAPAQATGTTIGWGTNIGGELGVGYRSAPIVTPTAGTLRGVRQVAAGYTAGYALLGDGTVRAWGGNYTGALGDGTTLEKVNPISIPGLSGVAQIAAAGAHAMALLADGTVLTWGGNFFGTLGNGTRDSVEGAAHPVPIRVPGLSGVIAIASGGGDDAALLANGTVVAWGENKNGQLGDGTKETKLTPTPVKGLSGVRAIAIGGISSLGGHMLALLADGRVMASGQNAHGQLGLGDSSDRLLPVTVPSLANVVGLSASATHSLALLAGGGVLSWGADENGELGYGAPETCEGTPCGRIPRTVAVPAASAVSAGWRFSVVVSEEEVLSWGINEVGQLGDGNTTQSTTPVRLTSVAGVHGIAAGEKFTLATAEYGPSPEFSVAPVPGGLLAQWASLAGAERWTLSWRPFTKPRGEWSKPVVLPATTHSYAIAGLAHELYEVKLTRLNSTFGFRIAYGTPG